MMEKFVIVKDILKKVKRFNLTGRSLEFKLKAVPIGVEPVGWLKDAVNDVIQRGTEGLTSNDQVGFSFCSKEFARGEGGIRFRPAGEISYDDVWNVISNIYQSNSTGLDTETFCLGVTSVKMPAGKGRGHLYNTFEEECGQRRGIIVIKNKDNMCLPRALAVGIACLDKDPEQYKVRMDRGKLQTQRAVQLLQDAYVVIPEEGCGIPELQQFQRYLQNYKIVVYSYGSKGRDVIFEGATYSSRRLNLLYHEGHYNVITSLTAAFCCNYYCEVCHIPYDHKDKHRCGGTCAGCRQSPACPQDVKVTCGDCKRSFRGQHCYDNHINKHICEQIRRCEHCFKVIQGDRKHTCGEIFCKICNKHQPSDHKCYIQPDTKTPPIKDLLFVFYDLETRQEKLSEDGSILHEPNLCVFKQCCDSCMDTSQVICKSCGVRLQVLKCNDPISPFVYHMLTLRKKFKNIVVLAHNGGGFDHQFVLNYILTKTDLKPELIMRGTKIISMVVGNVKFLDSLNYFPMALSKLPKAFDLVVLKKGYFPHLFNTHENQNYMGPLPALEYYGPDNLNTKDRSTLCEWHGQKTTENNVFDFQKEIVDYCISDVEILTLACLKFRQLMLNETKVCPFTEACTIASTCNKVFRRNFLKPNTIGIIPKNGYRWCDNQSQIAIQWLVWEEKEMGINILHAAKQQEAIVAGIKVDGFCLDTNQVFEFHGCYYHGCPVCFKLGRDDSLHNDDTQTLNTRYEATVAKTKRLRDLGYEVVEMWGCEFRKLIKNNDEILRYVESHPLIAQTPLNPRDAFYGGRTGNTYEYYKCKEEEKIKYVDVCSLYPWACKYGKFPVGHPRVFVGKECSSINLSSISGLIKCKILPPGDLYHPVLPHKMNNKLMFVLCRKCGEEMNQDKCKHSYEQRCLTGTWVIEEVVKAVNKGYEILQTYEIWKYDTVQYGKNDTGLFTEMMNKFIKIKQESSDWPQSCRTQAKKEQYIVDFLQREDVLLEFNKITNNPGLRSLAKLMLNSFWGKFGQCENQPKTSIVNQPADFFGMLSNSAIYVNTVLPINDNTLIVNWEYREEAYEPLSTVNVVIAAYVTTQARLKLYSYLERLGERSLYFDTDSIIFVSTEEETYDVPTGEFIGDMTDELKGYGPGSYITEFVSGGPKNYSYKVWSPTTNEEHIVCKVKGISLNYAASQLVNFNTIKEMVLNPAEPIYITSKNIRRMKTHEVVSREESKIYKTNSTKRKFQTDHTSLPYGHKKFKLN